MHQILKGLSASSKFSGFASFRVFQASLKEQREEP